MLVPFLYTRDIPNSNHFKRKVFWILNSHMAENPIIAMPIPCSYIDHALTAVMDFS